MTRKKKKIKRWKSRSGASDKPRQVNTRRPQVKVLDDEYEQYKAERRWQQEQNSAGGNSRRAETVRRQGDRVHVRDAEKRRNGQVQHRKRKRKNVLAMVLILTIAFVIGITASVFVFFKVDEIKVEGCSKYSEADIVEASGIELGDNLFACNTGAAAKAIITKKPYVGSVEFQHKLPGTLVICVKENTAVFAFQSGGKYILTDKNKKILEISAALPESAALISGANLKNNAVGTIAECTSTEKDNYIGEIHIALSKAGLSKITEINVENDVNLFAVYDGRVKLKFGQDDSLLYKSQLAASAIKDLEKDNKNVKGSLNLKQASSMKQAYYDPEF